MLLVRPLLAAGTCWGVSAGAETVWSRAGLGGCGQGGAADEAQVVLLPLLVWGHRKTLGAPVVPLTSTTVLPSPPHRGHLFPVPLAPSHLLPVPSDPSHPALPCGGSCLAEVTCENRSLHLSADVSRWSQVEPAPSPESPPVGTQESPAPSSPFLAQQLVGP